MKKSKIESERGREREGGREGERGIISGREGRKRNRARIHGEEDAQVSVVCTYMYVLYVRV